MATWTAQTSVAGVPDDVLALLTELESIARWSPVPFELERFSGERLIAGARVGVRGRLAGSAVRFDVRVGEADDGRLTLTALGPIRLDVEYVAVASEDGSDLCARVEVSGSGLTGRVLARATDAMLAAGALRAAIGRIARELEPARGGECARQVASALA